MPSPFVPGIATSRHYDLIERVPYLQGLNPAPIDINAIVPENSELEAYTVVTIDPETMEASAAVAGTPANGVILSTVVTGAGETVDAAVLVAGCINPAGVVWDSSFDTLAKKTNAFVGASAPTNIIVRPTL